MDNSIKTVSKESVDIDSLEEESFEDLAELYIDEVAMILLPHVREIEIDSIRNINLSLEEIEEIIAKKCYTQALAMAKAKLKYNNPPNIK